MPQLNCGCIPGKVLCAQASALWMHANHAHNLMVQGMTTQTEANLARLEYNQHLHLEERPIVKLQKDGATSFVFVIENIAPADSDNLLDDLLDFLAERGYEEIPVAIPGDVIEAKFGGGHGQAQERS